MRVALALLVASLFGTVALAGDVPVASPFDGLRFDGDVPNVRVGGEWHVLLAIDGVEARAVVEHARKAHGLAWEKRFREDLVQLIDRDGQAAGAARGPAREGLANG